jgi:uncharacterized protein
MLTADQSEVLEFLGSPSTHGGDTVERIETHASVVFLAGTRAWKLKRAVRYNYLDFSTVERRKAMCEAEVRINQRTAPALYRGVAAVAREADGSLALGGPGTPVDWVVEMVRFDQDGLFDRLAARGALNLELMRPLATAIARLHLSAERRSDSGGRSGMAWVIDGNATGLVEHGAGFLDQAACVVLSQHTQEQLQRDAGLLDVRRDAGFVRQCHGDLHLRNIVLLDGRPTLFDGVEFNDKIACIDVFYDLAFLLMDLWRRRLGSHANAVWNAYLSETRDFEGVGLLPLFLSCRAAVRSKTSATAANVQSDPQRRSELEETARDYLALAHQLLRPPPACLIGIGGLSGSGKSTLAYALGPLLGAVPGAVVIRSDEIRKSLYGAESSHRLGPEGYSPEISQRVYTMVTERAELVARSGHAAIADAVFARASDRQAIERAAAAAGVPFVGVWLDVPESALIARAERRRLDASDAGADVIRNQVTQGTGPISWHRISASSPAEDVLQKVIVMLGEHLKTGTLRGESRTA